MAYSSGPSDPSRPNGSTAFAGGRLTAEEAERLSATFRPSWEVEEGPFAGSRSSSAKADLPALPGLGPGLERLPGPRDQNGTPANQAASVTRTALLAPQPEHSVIGDPLARAGVASAPSQRTAAVFAPTPAARVSHAAPRATPKTLLEDDVGPLKRAKTGVWIAIVAAVAVVMGVAFWLSSGSGEKQIAPAEPTAKTAVAPRPAPMSIVETTAAKAIAAPPPASAAPAATVTAAAPIANPTVAPVPAPAPPSPPALARPAWVPRQPAPPAWSPPPRPVARPKGGNTTIVRDVPF